MIETTTDFRASRKEGGGALGDSSNRCLSDIFHYFQIFFFIINFQYKTL